MGKEKSGKRATYRVRLRVGTLASWKRVGRWVGWRILVHDETARVVMVCWSLIHECFRPSSTRYKIFDSCLIDEVKRRIYRARQYFHFLSLDLVHTLLCWRRFGSRTRSAYSVGVSARGSNPRFVGFQTMDTSAPTRKVSWRCHISCWPR